MILCNNFLGLEPNVLKSLLVMHEPFEMHQVAKMWIYQKFCSVCFVLVWCEYIYWQGRKVDSGCFDCNPFWELISWIGTNCKVGQLYWKLIFCSRNMEKTWHSCLLIVVFFLNFYYSSHKFLAYHYNTSLSWLNLVMNLWPHAHTVVQVEPYFFSQIFRNFLK